MVQTYMTPRGKCEIHTAEDFEIGCRAVDRNTYPSLGSMLDTERRENTPFAFLGFASTAKSMIRHAHTASYGLHALDIHSVY